MKSTINGVQPQRATNKETGEKKPKRGLWQLYRTSLLGDVSVISDSVKRTRERLAALAGQQREEMKHETFADAVARLHLTDDRLQRKHQEFEFTAAVWFALCAVSFVFLLLSVVSAHPISQAALSIGVMALAASHAIKARFRAAQVRQRELFGFTAWLFGRGHK
ncbi:hypothetical protein KDX27_39055 [Burkholderia cenocepacia]|uniref:hypothetical protein n=1 Tax=Burkholderia cenocepacia TaxID=95486 RepID=UPI001B9CAD4F|nr:hypothetical protein [Burkholderia cenocepacia]MBR8029899.1 hypothetical protein [Burkholderia cenocepacia]MBR8173691.1 hypothetical protein [Burkholderia cenocepacia]